MEESELFPLEKTCVKTGTVLIETVLSGDSLYFSLDAQPETQIFYGLYFMVANVPYLKN